MFRNGRTGFWEEDFQRKGLPRLHVSYGVKRKDDARAASEAVHRVYRERRRDLIDRLKAGDVSAHELAGIIADGKPLGAAGALVAAANPWPAVADAVEDYVEYLRTSERKSGGTHVTAEVQLTRFIKSVGGETIVDQITVERVIDYQRELFAEQYAQNTVVSYVSRVSGLFTWLVKREKKDARREQRPARTLEVPIDRDEIANRQTSRERWLTEPEAERLLAAAPGSLLACVMLGLFAGLRIEEMLHLRPQYDVDLKLGIITVQEQPTWHPKNRKKRMVPIAQQLRPVLERHLARYASESWLFPSPVLDEKPMTDGGFSVHFQRIVRAAELVSGREDPRGVVFHTLRHTFASWLVMKGVDLYTVSKLLGNSLAMVEKTYAHLAPDFRARALDKLAGIVAIPTVPTEEQ